MKRPHLVLTVLGIILVACAPVNNAESPPVTRASTPTAFATNTFTPTPEPTSTQEVLSLPANFMDNQLYAVETAKNDWSYNAEKNEIWVNWAGTGKQEDYELAFEKMGDKWEVRKFVLEREQVDISNLTCKVIYGGSTASCIQEQPGRPNEFHIKFIPGDLVLETIPTPDGDMQIIWTDALTKRGEEEERIKIALQVDMGDGMDAASFKGQKSAVSIFEIADLFPTNGSFTFTFSKSNNGFNVSRDYRQLVFDNTETYKNFFLGKNIPDTFIFLPAVKQNVNFY